jgi:hypothetical protein
VNPFGAETLMRKVSLPLPEIPCCITNQHSSVTPIQLMNHLISEEHQTRKVNLVKEEHQLRKVIQTEEEYQRRPESPVGSENLRVGANQQAVETQAHRVKSCCPRKPCSLNEPARNRNPLPTSVSRSG